MLSGIDEGDPGSFHRPVIAGKLLWFMKGKIVGNPMKGKQRIAIGIYVDSDGVTDFSPDEILATLGYPLTAENRNEAEQFVLRVYLRGLKEQFEWPALGDVIT